MSEQRELTLRQQFREVFAVVWELLKRRPLLGSLPIFAIVWLAHRELLEEWLQEAEQAAREKGGFS